MNSPSLSRAEACANIALAKYWGKSPRGGNLTAVPSLSLTLSELRTRTEVCLAPSAASDSITLNGQEITGEKADRVIRLLDEVRNLSGNPARAVVTTWNNFPTAAGLASSASGFAALALAAAKAFGLRLSRAELSRLARRASASAGRSVFGGYVELATEAEAATPIAAENHWDLRMLVAVVHDGPKAIGSTGGMVHTALTSPYYPAWVEGAQKNFEQVKQAVLARDFEALAEPMEHSTLLMHATMMTSQPPVLYWKGASVELIHSIRGRRAQGIPEAFTMDAGPNVKVLTPASNVEKTANFLRSVPGVGNVIVCSPGPDAGYLQAGGDLRAAARSAEAS